MRSQPTLGFVSKTRNTIATTKRKSFLHLDPQDPRQSLPSGHFPQASKRHISPPPPPCVLHELRFSSSTRSRHPGSLHKPYLFENNIPPSGRYGRTRTNSPTIFPRLSSYPPAAASARGGNQTCFTRRCIARAAPYPPSPKSLCF